MKKIIGILLSVILVFSLAACGNNAHAGKSESGDTETLPASEEEILSESNQETLEREDVSGEGATGETPAPSEEPAEAEGGKTLVVYFSATGNTKDMAEYIAEATEGELFELVPVEPYTDDDLDYNDDDSRVVYEHEHPDDRNIELEQVTVDNWSEYDTVFIGYPIWWHAAAWPVDAFIKANDFTDKTVIPFCTSGSSGLEDSGELLAEMAGTGEWLEGQRFSGSASKEQVTEWVQGLGVK